MSIMYKGQKIKGPDGKAVTINGVKTKSIVAGENVEISQEGNILTIGVKEPPPVVQSIVITTPPNKTTYQLGDVFDPTGMVVTATYDKGPLQTVTDYTISPDGPLQEGDSKVTISYTEGDVTVTAEQPITVKSYHIYGVRWDGTASTKWSRTDDAAGFVDPVPYLAGASSYSSPFDNLQPWAGMVKSNRAAGTMVAIPKFWYKLEQNTPGTPSSGMAIRIADGPIDGFSTSPAHMDRGDGRGERDVVYVGRYHCATSTYKSETNKLPQARVTLGNFRTSIHALGSTVWQLDFATRFTIWLLYLVEFADWNSQACIGYGCGNNSYTEKMGYTDSMPYHTGTTQTSRTTYGLGTQYRNIEGLWDNIFDWVDGCYSDDNGLNIILNPNNFSDSSGGELVGLPSINTGTYPSEFTVSTTGGFPMFYPTKIGGSESSFSCDSWGFRLSKPCVDTGGYYGRNGNAGIGRMGYANATMASASDGSRPMELP